MENFECPICTERFIEPIECLSCNNNFCKKHVKGFNNVCPLCKASPFNYGNNAWLSRAISNFNFPYKCSLCDFEGYEESFWLHLIDQHKNNIINHFNKKKNLENSKNINYTNNNQNINENKKENDNDVNNSNNNNIQNNINRVNNKIINSPETQKERQMKYPDFELLNKNNSLCFGPISERVKNSNIQNLPPDNNINQIQKNRQNEINSSKNISPLTQRNYNKLYYCNKRNYDIPCNCCPDHICREGNCMCIKCMRYNTKKLNANKDELINKAGKIAKIYKGNYFCGEQYETIFENILGIKFKNQSKCQYPLESCPNCKVLNIFKDKYLK